jgi:hypothetical protein
MRKLPSAGVLVPWVTHAGGETTSVFDSYSLAMPFGVSVQGQGRMFVDFEFIPTVNQTPHETTRTVDPGILCKLNHGFALLLFPMPARRRVDLKRVFESLNSLCTQLWDCAASASKAVRLTLSAPPSFTPRRT